MWTHYKIDDGEWRRLEEDDLSGGFYVILDVLKKRLLPLVDMEVHQKGWRVSIKADLGGGQAPEVRTAVLRPVQAIAWSTTIE